jgi:MFS transporter, OFA family, oxalate/formate antiporter
MNSPERANTSLFANPWVQLSIGVICMASVANLQYGWTLFVDPINAKYHWGRTDIQFAFTIFVVIETWLIPVEGYLVDRFGPRWVVVGGAVLVALAWSINSMASDLPLLYVAAAIGGVGTGCVYGTCVGNALKWFPGRRGLAAGITAAGFGVGAAFTISPISNMINASGYQHAFLFFGLLQGAIVLVMACGMLAPSSKFLPTETRIIQTKHGYSPAEVLRSPCFYVMYVMFVLVAAGGLTMAASIAPIAKDFKIDKIPVAMFGLTMPAIVFALKLNRIFDGLGRPFFGWVSDHIGRENTMAIAFVLGAVALYTLAHVGSDPIMFVLITASYFAVFGEIYSLFPATQGDTFGAKFAATNAGMLYTAKGVGSLLVPVAASIADPKGWNLGWSTVFMVAMWCNLLAAALGLFVLKPMRSRHFAASRVKYSAEENAGATSRAQAAPATTNR